MKTNLYEEITARIVADMEAGAMPWERGFSAKNRTGSMLPSNATTGKTYRGINILLLWARAMELGVNSLEFLTYKQAEEAGGNVRRGEKGSQVVFFTKLDIKDKATGKDKQIPFLRQFTVFHSSQVEGCTLKANGPIEAPAMPEDTVDFIKLLGAKLTHGTNQPCYTPALDLIKMPFPQDYKTADGYRCTLYHELTHWTGADGRMGRKLSTSQGTEQYSREELIAELGGAFLCAEFGVPYQTRHASYLDHYVKLLKTDSKAIFQAASAAQKAVDYMRERVVQASIETMAIAA